MSTAEEVLAADLGVDGISGWGRLYDTIVGKLEFEMVFPDGRKEMRPMAQRRTLLDDPDAQVRRAALDGANKVFAQVEDTMAAVVGSVSGEVRFHGLTPTSMKLEGLEKHQRLVDSYKKLHAARAAKAGS